MAPAPLRELARQQCQEAEAEAEELERRESLAEQQRTEGGRGQWRQQPEEGRGHDRETADATEL